MMRRALAIAERGRGAVGTNPLVGAVVVRAGRVVGEGFHARFGGPHAEAVALSSAGDRSKGATLYVTLEPCAHLGKTPPCTRMVIASGVRRVVIAMADPLQKGRGIAELRRAGIRVESGLLADEAKAMNREWLTRLVTRRPYLTLKLATTLDGRIADSRGRSKWISSASAREWTRALRRQADAVLVGAGTVRADDPGFSRSVRIVVDGRAAISPRARMLRGGRTLVAVSRAASAARLSALADAGAEILVLPGRGAGISLPALMATLMTRGIGSIVCEGGSDLAGGLLRDELVDRVVMVQAPILLGGGGSLAAIGGPGRPLARAIRLGPVRFTRIGPDLICEADVLRRKG